LQKNIIQEKEDIMANQLRASWGVQNRTSPSGVTGVVTDYDESVEPVAAPLQDEVGADIGHTVYDKKTTVTMTVQCKANSSLPAVDSLFTVGNKTGYVDRANITENNSSYMKFSVTVSRFKANPQIDTP
jgi:hypothetical protein